MKYRWKYLIVVALGRKVCLFVLFFHMTNQIKSLENIEIGCIHICSSVVQFIALIRFEIVIINSIYELMLVYCPARLIEKFVPFSLFRYLSTPAQHRILLHRISLVLLWCVYECVQIDYYSTTTTNTTLLNHTVHTDSLIPPFHCL